MIRTLSKHGPEQARCPFSGSGSSSCGAAFSDGFRSRVHDPDRCGNEEHETCALYLSKLLRGVRPWVGGGVGDLARK